MGNTGRSLRDLCHLHSVRCFQYELPKLIETNSVKIYSTMDQSISNLKANQKIICVSLCALGHVFRKAPVRANVALKI